jgi:hypothetical protein
VGVLKAVTCRAGGIVEERHLLADVEPIGKATSP